MSRWLLTVVAFGFACCEVRAADPKPLWEIEAARGTTGVREVYWLGYSPDGKTLVAQIDDNLRTATIGEERKERLAAWDVATRKEKFSVPLGSHTAGLGCRANAFTKSGTVLVANGNVLEVRLSDGKVVRRDTAKVIGPKLYDHRAWAAWPTPNGSKGVWFLDGGDRNFCRIAVGEMPGFEDKPREIGMWAVTPFEKHATISAVTVSPDGTHIALRDDRGFESALALYTLAVGDELKLTEVASVPRAHRGGITTMQFSPDGKTLATGSGDSSVCIWDVAKAGKDWKPRATLSTGLYTLSALAFSPDGRTLAAGTFDVKVRPNLYLIDVTGGKEVASYRLGGGIYSLTYSPDGKTLLTGDARGYIKAWDAEALRNP